MPETTDEFFLDDFFTDDIFPVFRNEALEKAGCLEKQFQEDRKRETAEQALHYYKLAEETEPDNPDIIQKRNAMQKIVSECCSAEAAFRNWEAGKRLSALEIYLVGRCYYDGFLTFKNQKEGMLWIWDAADHGLPAAQFEVGQYCLSRLKHHAQYCEKGVAFIRAAAESGLPQAQCELGHLYKYGRYVPRNYAEAEKWYTLAVQNGDSQADTFLRTLQRRMGKENRIS